jgi:hypothetical protein
MYIHSLNNWPCVNHTLKNSMASIDNSLSLLSSRPMLVSSLSFKYSPTITNGMAESLVPPMHYMKFCTKWHQIANEIKEC